MRLEKQKILFKQFKEKRLKNRYISYTHILPLLNEHENRVEKIGESVLGIPIQSIKIGSGPNRVLLWSQMHGNESTTTKALFDVINTLLGDLAIQKRVLKKCTILIIPMLNPDGANVYTRLNANAVDLNRDAQNLSQPESVALKTVFDAFKPHFCFNLHGQRTLFNVGRTNKSAIVSFLSPAQDKSLRLTPNRKLVMSLIVKLNSNLQKQIPKHIAIYDDTFNINCVGDAFQSEGVPTILFEAGHYLGDYKREKTREYIYQSILLALVYIADGSVKTEDHTPYFEIPQNGKQFYDIIIKNCKFINSKKTLDIGINYEEVLLNNEIDFVPKVKCISDLSDFFGHKTIHAKNAAVLNEKACPIQENNTINAIILNGALISLKVS